ncbi:MAG: hypothetical protein CV082_08600 [Candidatus Brocadia sp. BL1]|nr:MAG: hypothetical protein CV082_08600 [Candidatus Brocadia sp. BL1]
MQIAIRFLSYPNAFIGYPVNPELSGFPMITCGNDISKAIKQDMQISDWITLKIAITFVYIKK